MSDGVCFPSQLIEQMLAQKFEMFDKSKRIHGEYVLTLLKYIYSLFNRNIASCPFWRKVVQDNLVLAFILV